MTPTSKRSLISECVTMIRIDIHPKGEEPDQHIVCLASRVSCTTTICEVPTKSKLGPCSRDEVLAPSDHPAWPSSWAASFSLQQTTSKLGGTIQQSSYWATRFTGPHKPKMWSVQIQCLFIGAKMTWSLINKEGGGGYHLEASE
jgi:hypothetical protein